MKLPFGRLDRIWKSNKDEALQRKQRVVQINDKFNKDTPMDSLDDVKRREEMKIKKNLCSDSAAV